MDTSKSRSMRILTNPKQVFHQLEELIQEWYNWQKHVAQIHDHDYDPNTQSKVCADGEENMYKHEVLQEKTLTFLDNNVDNHGFIVGIDNTKCDRDDLRLAIRVKHRIQDLEIIKARLIYAKVPESFWKERAKDLFTKITNNPDKTIELLTEALKHTP
ncbi:hypothetical protein [Maridesulfovibrio sp. FT414]|uniref:hypothetical protein n=1 Tax=Maridesulfovibrio sp. FT414 TaxID=2979469 RepID=UPI003D8042C3